MESNASCFAFILGADNSNLSFILGILFTAIVALIIGGVAGYLIYRYYARKALGSVKDEVDQLRKKGNEERENAYKEAEAIKKDAKAEAKEETKRLKDEANREIEAKKQEVARNEQRVNQRDEQLNKREASLDNKSDLLDERKHALETKEEKITALENEVKDAHNKMLEELEKVAKLSQDEAREELRKELIDEVKQSSATEAKQIEQQAKDEANKVAKKIVGLAIQKCAAEHTSESTTSTVSLPNEEMKGRLIGRVGRNIRAIENATGVDLIIDDTPDAVTISCFEPMRREIAKNTIERLVSDGRIHPAKIEETVEKVKKEIENQVKEAGESAAFDANVYNLHPEIVKLLGRLKYRTSYGQNVLEHSLEVSYLAGVMAAELGVDVKIAKRAGLLHDIGKAVDHELEGTHVQIGVDIAKKFKESRAVVHCIEAHHGDVEPETVEAVLVQAADAISSARPGARRESVENYIKRLEKLEAVANSFDGVEQSYAIQAGREIRVMVKPEKVDDAAMVFMAKSIASKVENELEYPGQIKVSVIREVRQTEYAK